MDLENDLPTLTGRATRRDFFALRLRLASKKLTAKELPTELPDRPRDQLSSRPVSEVVAGKKVETKNIPVEINGVNIHAPFYRRRSVVTCKMVNSCQKMQFLVV